MMREILDSLDRLPIGQSIVWLRVDQASETFRIVESPEAATHQLRLYPTWEEAEADHYTHVCFVPYVSEIDDAATIEWLKDARDRSDFDFLIDDEDGWFVFVRATVPDVIGFWFRVDEYRVSWRDYPARLMRISGGSDENDGYVDAQGS